MKLDRLTPCQLFKIRSPIWSGSSERRKVGLNAALIKMDNCIQFTYRRKSDGQLSIPGEWYFDGSKLNQVDYERINRKGTTLVLIPFKDLEVLERG